MKLRYLLTALVAGAAFFSSCEEEPDHYLDEVKVSSSYVSVNVNGGSTIIDLTTTDSWSITDIPDWLTVSPTSGSAGSGKITFSAESTLDGRCAEVYIKCAGKVQILNVIQGLTTIAPATVKEIFDGPDKTYRVTGVITKIAESGTYGNWYLNDGTYDTDLYIYGTLYNGQEKQGAINKLGLEVGDEVTIEGPKTIYGSTVELVDVTVISFNKSLIKVTSVEPENGNLSSDGGDFTVNLQCKTSNGIFASVPEDAASWLSIKSINGNSVVFHADANTAGPRSTTLVFKTTDGSKDYTAETSLSQDGLSGTLDLPMTVAEAIAAANAGSTASVYVKGIVSNVLSGGYGSYGNASFWISADGKYNDDLELDFEAYRANWLGGNPWVEGNAQIEVGAEVIIYGALTLYKGTSEIGTGGYVYSINGVTSEENGIGTLAAPFNAVGGIQAAQAGIASKVYVEGKVSELVSGGMSASYGNGSFWISQDGTKHGDLSLDFEAFQVNWLGGNKWVEGDNPQIKIGDEVTLYGPLTTYKGTSETAGKGVAYIYELNGSTE